MALVAWYPLNKDLKNYGSETELDFSVNYNVVKNSESKFGSSVYCGNTIMKVNKSPLKLNSVIEGFSISFWVYRLDLISSYPSGNYVNIGENFGFRIRGSSNSRVICHFVKDKSATGDNKFASLNLNGDIPIVANKWYHIAVVYKNRNIKTFINGNKSVDYDFPQSFDDIEITKDVFRIGSSEYSGNVTNEKFDGYINDVRIYDEAISDKQVKEIAKGLALHYKLDSLNNGNIIDYSGFGNNGTVVGTITESNDTSRYQKSLQFTESSYIAHDRCLSNSNQEWTCCAWFKRTSDNSNGACLNNFNWSNGNPCGNWIGYQDTGRKFTPILFTSNDYSGGTANYVYGKGIPSLNQWHHIAFVFKEPSEILNIYVDGELYNSSAKQTGGGTLGLSDTVKCFERFIGYASDYREYATCLSADDVKQLYEDSAIIDDKGNLYCYELVEETTINKDLSNKLTVWSAGNGEVRVVTPISNGWNINVTVAGSASTTATTGIQISDSIFENNNMYRVKYKVKKISGELKNIGGHSRFYKIYGIYIDGKYVGTTYHVLLDTDISSETSILNDTNEHIIEIICKRDDSLAQTDTDANLYIQINRGHRSVVNYNLTDISVEEIDTSYFKSNVNKNGVFNTRELISGYEPKLSESGTSYFNDIIEI